MNRYYVFGTFGDFPPNVCEDLQQKCSKYRETLEHFCCKPKQTAEISRAENIISIHLVCVNAKK